MEGDFFSLYPTVMIAHNISPENVLLEPNDNSLKVDMNYGLGKKEDFIYFDQSKQGIIP